MLLLYVNIIHIVENISQNKDVIMTMYIILIDANNSNLSGNFNKAGDSNMKEGQYYIYSLWPEFCIVIIIIQYWNTN